MRTSENITDLTKALISFHKEVGKIKKEDKNPFFKSSYAGLPSILDAISEPLNKNELVIVQAPNETGLTTRLMHSSGQWIESTYNMPVSKQNDPQAVGSAITYARRYAIGAILSLNIDEDDDANAAAGNNAKVYPINNTSNNDDLPWLDEKPFKAMIAFLEGDKSDKAKETIREKMKKYKIKKDYREQINALLT